MEKPRYIAIIEDERHSSDLLKEYLIRFANEHKMELRISQFYDCGSFAKTSCMFFDIIFLDIMLPDGNGMDVARKIRKDNNKSQIVFVTNLANYALGGFEVGACDYILKPITYDSFEFKFKRVCDILERNKDVHITIKNQDSIRVIKASDIYYIDVEGHAIRIHTKNDVIKTSGTLSGYYKMLQGLPFEYCNQCFLVNLGHVTQIKGDDVIVGSDSLRISRPKKKSFLESLNNFLGL